MRSLLPVVPLTAALALCGCNCGKTNTLMETYGVLQLETTSVDFGPVTEFAQKTLPVRVHNGGKGALTILSATLDSSSSPEFTLSAAPAQVEPNATVDINVTFSPLGPGEDTGAVNLVTDDPDHPNGTVSLHGGPIFPALGFEPDGGALAFAPAMMEINSRMVAVRSVGGSTLHVTAVGVNAGGNPDFSIVPPMLPASIKPGAAIAVQVDYVKSLRDTNGILEVISDGADGGLSQLLLVPDPLHACGDGTDNDLDGLTDFPDDIGCTSADDDDEYNPADCVNGAMKPCGSMTGSCRQGQQICAHSIWGACDGGVGPHSEACNGEDDNCNGVTDEGISEVCTIFGCPGARACIPDSGVADGGYTPCIPVTAMPEQCNGLDDNCDGTTDEGILMLCTVNGCAGLQICIPGGDGGFTSCMPTAAHPELCNGVDDDCNGVTDDNLAPQLCGQGACLRSAPGCVDGGVPACMPGASSTEQCNGVDDNCNGVTDDGISNLTCGTGACFRSVAACLIDGGMAMCTPGAMSSETCNNIDDNCNGSTDESLSTACYDGGSAATRNKGRCKDGTATCTGGMFGNCVGQIGPLTEQCANNIDDNCNGSTDEGCGMDAGTPDAGCNVWYQAHQYNPVTNMPTPFSYNMFLNTEAVATKITPPASAFPLTITHLRFKGRNAGQSVILEIRPDSGGFPGSVVYSTTVTSNGTYQIVPLPAPLYTFSTPTSFWVGMEGTGMPLTMVAWGDGSPPAEATSNMCLDFLFGWETWADLGPPFTSIGDLLFAVGQCP